MSTPLHLAYDRGTVLVSQGPPGFDYADLPGVLFDPRTSTWRAQGRYYRAIVEHCIKQKLAYADEARGWENKDAGWKLTTDRTPHPHQAEAVATWLKSGRRGVVVLPTGTGKTFVAMLCIEKVSRPALVVTPTIDLMRQWVGQLSEFFGMEVGAVGGGDHDVKPVTVTTYDSALIKMEYWGNRFGLIVFDECHHLPGASISEAAVMSLAPFRLGLTATPERADGGEAVLPSLIGPIVYRREITELSGDYLAEYQTQRVYIDLTPQEEDLYRRYRQQYSEYRNYLIGRGISLSGPNGWQKFIFEASRTPDGMAALKAYREQKRIERTASGKFRALEELFRKHAGERFLIFTADNATVYQVARQYLVPAITAQTKTKERKQILERFHSGEYSILVTCQVLNEGVDVPAASVGIVLSGTGTIKENVQRLGRILRKYGDKQAVLYEVVARGTAEEFTSDRRRQHHAFTGSTNDLPLKEPKREPVIQPPAFPSSIPLTSQTTFDNDQRIPVPPKPDQRRVSVGRPARSAEAGRSASTGSHVDDPLHPIRGVPVNGRLIAVKAYLLAQMTSVERRSDLRKEAEDAAKRYAGGGTLHELAKAVLCQLIVAELDRDNDPIPSREAAFELANRLKRSGVDDPARMYMKIVEATERKVTTAHYGDFTSAPIWSHNRSSRSPVVVAEQLRARCEPVLAAVGLAADVFDRHSHYLWDATLADLLNDAHR